MFYQLSALNFRHLKQSGIDEVDLMPMAKSYALLCGTFMALEHYLKELVPPSAQPAVTEVFNPEKRLFRKVLPEAEDDTPEWREMVLLETAVPYLTPSLVQCVAEAIREISDQELLRLYNPDQLNRAGIYPRCWTWAQDDFTAYSDRSLVEEFRRMKQLFLEAAFAGDYILAVTG